MKNCFIKDSKFSIKFIKFNIVMGLFFGLALMQQVAQASWYDEHPGSDLTVHFVHLTGFGGDNALNRRNLSIEYLACVDRHEAFGKPTNPLPPGGIPPVITSQDIEIYYSPNRVLSVKQSTVYVIDQTACELQAKSKRMLLLNSAIGQCDINLNTKEAVGVCDESAHEHAPNSTLAKLAPTKAPVVDLSKLPPQIRAQVAAQINQLKQLPQGPGGANGTSLLSKGTYKNIANFRCETYRANALKSELCIAHPKSLFPIPAAPLNGGIPGLLLEVDNPALTLHAKEVKMDIAVSKYIFSIPKDIKITNIRLPMPGGNP